MLWLRILSRFQRRVRPAIMCDAVWRVLWIVEAVSGFGGVWRLAVAASFWRLFIRLIRRSRRTDGGGMLVGRTVGGEAGLVDVKLRGDGPGEAGCGFVLGVACAFGDAGAGAGPSVNSPQSSNESSSHVGCGGAGFAGAVVGCPSVNSPQSPKGSSFRVGCGGAGLTVLSTFFREGFVGRLVVECPSVNSPQSPKESSSHIGSGGCLLICCAIPWI